ncbi:MAG: GIY-YIG nuclease family protein [bacterium]
MEEEKPATKGKRPISLVFYCAFPTKEQAVEFEKYLKSGSGQSFRNKHLI